MKLSRTASYALTALLLLNDQGQDALVSCHRLAEAGKMPERFLLQILRELVNCGILTSVRGVDGGYRLARDFGQISVHDVMEAVEGPTEVSLPEECQMPRTIQEKLFCVLTDIATRSRSTLQEISLLDLANTDRPPAIETA